MAIATSDSISLNTIKALNDTANDAKTTAEELEQHFWFQDTGADAGAHITEVTQEEWSDPTDPNYHSGGNALITSAGMAIRQGLTPVAKFEQETEDGEAVSKLTLGTANTAVQSHAEINYQGLRLVDLDDKAFFEVKDKRMANGYAPYTDSFTTADAKIVGDPGSPSGYYYDLSYEPISGSLEVIVDGIATTAYTYMSPADPGWVGYSIMFTVAQAPTSTLVVNYLMEDDKAKAFTFGTRKKDSFVGRMSVAMGDNNEASGTYSVAIGDSNTSKWDDTVAIGKNTTARASQSMAVGLYTIASNPTQFVCGQYNIVSDTNGDDNLFIVGNGTGVGASRSNAFSVDKDGMATCESLFANGGIHSNQDVTSRSGKSLEDSVQSINFTATAGTTKTLSVPNNSAGYIITSGAHINNQNIYIYNVASTGAVTLKAMGTASNITTATSTRTITLTGASYATRYTVVAFYGDLPTVS